MSTCPKRARAGPERRAAGGEGDDGISGRFTVKEERCLGNALRFTGCTLLIRTP